MSGQWIRTNLDWEAFGDVLAQKLGELLDGLVGRTVDLDQREELLDAERELWRHPQATLELFDLARHVLCRPGEAVGLLGDTERVRLLEIKVRVEQLHLLLEQLGRLQRTRNTRLFGMRVAANQRSESVRACPKHVCLGVT